MPMPDKIAEGRRERGLTQQELADLVGMHRATISQIEVGLKVPSLKTLRKIAGALGKTMAQLLAEPAAPTEVPADV